MVHNIPFNDVNCHAIPGPNQCATCSMRYVTAKLQLNFLDPPHHWWYSLKLIQICGLTSCTTLNGLISANNANSLFLTILIYSRGKGF